MIPREAPGKQRRYTPRKDRSPGRLGQKVTLRQRVLREGALLVDALLSFACIDRDGKPQRVPAVFAGA